MRIRRKRFNKVLFHYAYEECEHYLGLFFHPYFVEMMKFFAPSLEREIVPDNILVRIVNLMIWVKSSFYFDLQNEDPHKDKKNKTKKFNSMVRHFADSYLQTKLLYFKFAELIFEKKLDSLKEELIQENLWDAMRVWGALRLEGFDEAMAEIKITHPYHTLYPQERFLKVNSDEFE